MGAWLEREQGDGLTVTDRKQSVYGGLAGFDFAAEGQGDECARPAGRADRL